jgi:hypothetical protein
MTVDIWAALAQRCRQPLQPVCACPDLDVTGLDAYRSGEREYIKGWAAGCPVHGHDGTQPTYARRRL